MSLASGPLLLPPELPHDLDQADDVAIEFVEILGGHPPFRVMRGADFLDGVAIHEARAHEETRDEAGTTRGHIPIPRDLDRVLLIRNRVKDRLTRKSRRPRRHAACTHERQFFGSGGAVEDGGFGFHVIIIERRLPSVKDEQGAVHIDRRRCRLDGSTEHRTGAGRRRCWRVPPGVAVLAPRVFPRPSSSGEIGFGPSHESFHSLLVRRRRVLFWCGFALLTGGLKSPTREHGVP